MMRFEEFLFYLVQVLIIGMLYFFSYITDGEISFLFFVFASGIILGWIGCLVDFHYFGKKNLDTEEKEDVD